MAVGVGEAFTSEFVLCPFAQTITPKRMIPTATAKTTRPEAPGFFPGAGTIPALAGGVAEVVEVAKAGAGVETISTRPLRWAAIGASGITNASTLLFAAVLFTAFFAVFFTALFLTALFLTVAFLAVVALGAVFFRVNFFAAAFLATDFLAVAFFTATVTPWVAVRTLGNAHLWEKVTPGLQALRLPVVQSHEEIVPDG